jgi:hypothetical protein
MPSCGPQNPNCQPIRLLSSATGEGRTVVGEVWVGMMRSPVAVLLSGLLLALQGEPAHADQIKLAIYVGLVEDICPEGYDSEHRCGRLTGAKFDELRNKGRLLQLRTWGIENVDFQSQRDRHISVRLGDELGRARRYRAVERMHPSSAQVAVVVVEWPVAEKKPPKQDAEIEEYTYGIPEQFFGLKKRRRAAKKIERQQPPARRSFDHATLGNLDPEVHYGWEFRQGDKHLTISFE